MCLPSDALLQHLPSYLGISYLRRGISLHGCSSKAQPLLLILDEGYLLTAALPDLQRGIAPLGPPAPVHRPLLGAVLLLLAATPGLGREVAPSRYIYTPKYYSTIKQNEIMPFASTWMDLESVILSEVSQTAEKYDRHSLYEGSKQK